MTINDLTAFELNALIMHHVQEIEHCCRTKSTSGAALDIGEIADRIKLFAQDLHEIRDRAERERETASASVEFYR